MPDEITDLTGITDEMVAGHRIDPEAVAAFAVGAGIIIAHNANFDRKFAERYWPLFQQKAWACSATEVEWRKNGFDGSRLGYLLAGAGLFHQAHRAIDDCRALVNFWLQTSQNRIDPLLRSSWGGRDARRCVFGPSNLPLNSRTN
ncbi:exonuclease domain-containing protein [Bradyrhizobium sp. 215_C5_N1_1]|uniref:exonuclease domain-containing protein n=1 Tax=unclassified Bradyrhizobium TaxID=2631580 RepID=UPI003F899F63